MNKEFIVHLLQKDIKELSLLTDGFEKMSEFPEPILRLAKEKTEDVLKALENLSDMAFLELGAIDYDNFKEEKSEPILDSDSHLPDEKNNFDAPFDPTIESQVNPYEIEVAGKEEVENQEEENRDSETDVFVEKEFQSDIADDISETEETEKADEDFELDIDESEENDLDTALEKAEENTEETAPDVSVVEVEDKKDKPDIQSHSIVFNDTLNYEDRSIAGNLANQKIEDIKQAINIGDRFRFQRELFGGNGEVLNKTISYLNQLANYSEAESFLKSKFGWDEDNPNAEEFLQIVKRRYL
ncbi:MAG: hypothetical protein GX102_01475 [Porphyromonadaceae bacterium]|nr:hypothetical protein [Porphyromonadaceae bacterium]